MLESLNNQWKPKPLRLFHLRRRRRFRRWHHQAILALQGAWAWVVWYFHLPLRQRDASFLKTKHNRREKASAKLNLPEQIVAVLWRFRRRNFVQSANPSVGDFFFGLIAQFDMTSCSQFIGISVRIPKHPECKCPQQRACTARCSCLTGQPFPLRYFSLKFHKWTANPTRSKSPIYQTATLPTGECLAKVLYRIRR